MPSEASVLWLGVQMAQLSGEAGFSRMTLKRLLHCEIPGCRGEVSTALSTTIMSSSSLVFLTVGGLDDIMG